MGIYIGGVVMPTGHPLWIAVHADGTVEANEVNPSRPIVWRTLRNAARPVPPHGRLIDADALLNNKGMGTQIAGWGKMYHETCIEYAPTVIPAEEDER